MCWGFVISEKPYFRNYPTWIRITVGGIIEGCKFVYEIKAMPCLIAWHFSYMSWYLTRFNVWSMFIMGRYPFSIMELQKNSREWCSFCRQFSRKASTRQETSWSYYLGLADVRILILLDQRKFFLPFLPNIFCHVMKMITTFVTE